MQRACDAGRESGLLHVGSQTSGLWGDQETSHLPSLERREARGTERPSGGSLGGGGGGKVDRGDSLNDARREKAREHGELLLPRARC